MSDLDALRRQLGDLDRDLFTLIARRQALGLEIGRRKLEAGLPPRDFSQEKVVLERAAQIAEHHGLSAELAGNVMLLLIEASLTAQEQSRVTRQASGEGRRVLVIGGAGKMGGWMARFLSSQEYQVEIADPKGPVPGYPYVSDWQDSGLDQDIIIVAAPLRASMIILEELASAPPNGLVFDIGSLKTPLRSALVNLAAAGASVTSVHPMFGPDTELLSGRHVIFVDVGVNEATRKARQLFDPTMAIQVEMDLDSHDRVIAYVLGLSHALNIAFFTALGESGEEVPDLMQFSSTTFDAQLDVAQDVAGENPSLYFEIQSFNDYGADALDSLYNAVDRIRSVVRDGDEGSFMELMLNGRAYLERRISRNG
jgi:chorismate mutase/prephenate dehydrogenase